MPGQADLLTALQVANLCAFAAVWVRFRRHSLHTIYTVFSWYVVFRFLRSSALLALPTDSAAYFQLWLVTEPVLWVFYVFLIRELYTLVLHRHEGIRRLSGWLFQTAFAVGIVVAALSVIPQSGLPGKSIVYLIFLSIGRFVVALVAVFLLALVAFLNWYPVNLNRNLILHSCVFAGYFLAYNLTYLLRSLVGTQAAGWVNLLLMSLSAGLALLWLFMSREGEIKHMRLREIWSRDEELALTGRLEALNAQLMRVAGK